MHNRKGAGRALGFLLRLPDCLSRGGLPWPCPGPERPGLTCLRMASRSWSCTRSSRRWMRVRRVLRGSEKRLKKLSCGSKLQAALTSSTYLGGKEAWFREGPSPSLQGPAQASPAKTSLIIPATTSISSRKWPSGAQLKTSSSEIGPLQENKDHSTQSDLSEYRCSNKN